MENLRQFKPEQLEPIEGLMFDFVSYIDRPGRTEETYLTNLKQFAAWVNYSGITRPERKDIIAFREYLLTEHEAIQYDSRSAEGWKYRTDNEGRIQVVSCSPGTAGQYIRTVKQFFKWTAAAGIYPNIADNIHPPQVKQTHRKEALTRKEVSEIENGILQGLQDSCNLSDPITGTADNEKHGQTSFISSQRATEQQKRLYAMFLLAVNAGLRTVELSRARVKDIGCRGDHAYIYVWGKGHSGADTKKPIAAEVYQAITDYLGSRSDSPTPQSPLFVSTGNRSGGKAIVPRTIGYMLKQAMRQAGYDSEQITAHSLRHTAGTCVMEMTGNLYDTQMYMRHENPKTTEIYIHTNNEDREAEIAKQLYDYYHGEGRAEK